MLRLLSKRGGWDMAVNEDITGYRIPYSRQELLAMGPQRTFSERKRGAYRGERCLLWG